MATGRHLCGSQRCLRLLLGGLADDVPVTLRHRVLLADVRTVGTCAHDGRQFPIGASIFGGLLSLFRGVWLTLGSLTLFLTSSGAQVDLDQGKTPAQLYASGCATCHKSPQTVTKTNSIFGLESFLSEHYTTSRESASLLAAYLRGLEKRSTESKRRRAAARSSRTNPSKPAPNVLTMDQPPRPPRDIPNQ